MFHKQTHDLILQWGWGFFGLKKRAWHFLTVWSLSK